MEMAPPKNWLKMIENIRVVRKKYPAPVDTMGCDQTHYRTEKPIDQRFLVLVSLMLSSQTKDPITWAAVQKLKDNGLGTPQKLLEAREKDIEDLIHPVGFFRRKAIYLKKVSQILLDQYNGDIPKSIEDLCKLPGVGPKMAHLCMLEAWNIVTGIGVDTHVHRISARLGWVPSKGIKTPEDTRKALEQWLPREYWTEINHMLVGFGQTICTPLHPKCSECTNNSICPSSAVNAGQAQKSPRSNVKKEKSQSSQAKQDQISSSAEKLIKVEAAENVDQKGEEEPIKRGSKAPRRPKKAIKVETQEEKTFKTPGANSNDKTLTKKGRARGGSQQDSQGVEKLVKIEPVEEGAGIGPSRRTRSRKMVS